jgi:hypothetical protein
MRLTRIEKTIVAAASKWRCGMCCELLPASYEIDHIIPYCLIESNRFIWALCPNCHGTKSLLERERTRNMCTLKRYLVPTSRLCYMCEHVVSIYFTHRCVIEIEDHREYWRTRLEIH